MKNIIILAAALAATAGLRAAAPSYSLTTDFTYASKYVFRGVETASASFQPSVELTSGDVNLGLWTNQPIIKSQADEVDFYGNYKTKINGALSLEGGATYYYYPEAPAVGGTKRTYEGNVGATWDVQGFSNSVFYYHDFRLKADTFQGSIGYKVPFSAIGSATLDTNVFIGSSRAKDSAPDAAGPAINESYTYWGAELSAPYKLNANATFTLAAHYTETRGLAGTPALYTRTNLWMTAGLTIGF